MEVENKIKPFYKAYKIEKLCIIILLGFVVTTQIPLSNIKTEPNLTLKATFNSGKSKAGCNCDLSYSGLKMNMGNGC